MVLVLGILVAIVATACMNYGVFLSKREVDRLPRLGAHSFLKTLVAFFRSKLWLQAQALQLLAGMLHVIAIGLAPLSVIEPVDTAGISFLVILTVIYLGERAGWVVWLGISVIITGVLFLGISLVRPTHPFSYRPIAVWFFIILLFGVVIYSFYVAFSRKDGREASFVGIGLGVLVGLNAVLIKLAWNDVGHLWHIYHFGSLWRSSYAVMAFLGSLSAQFFFQMALQRGKAMVVVPLVTGFSNMIPIVVGVLALKEPFPTEGKMVLLRLLSFMLIIGGAVLLSLREAKERKSVSATGAG